MSKSQSFDSVPPVEAGRAATAQPQLDRGRNEVDATVGQTVLRPEMERTEHDVVTVGGSKREADRHETTLPDANASMTDPAPSGSSVRDGTSTNT
jgi:hypothetical protein